MSKPGKLQRLLKRHRSIRKKISGTASRPRLFVRRSNRHMVACLIDDLAGKTLLTLTTDSREIAETLSGSKSEKAALLGARLAEKARELGVEKVVFDRGGHPFHGRVKALAEKAREGGLVF
jgi:large subunit ribosomal protein L18